MFLTIVLIVSFVVNVHNDVTTNIIGNTTIYSTLSVGNLTSMPSLNQSSTTTIGNSTSYFTPALGNITSISPLNQSTTTNTINITTYFTLAVGNLTSMPSLNQSSTTTIGNSTSYFTPALANTTSISPLNQSTTTNTRNLTSNSTTVAPSATGNATTQISVTLSRNQTAINSSTTQSLNSTTYTSTRSTTVQTSSTAIKSTTRTQTSTSSTTPAPFAYLYQVKFSKEDWYSDYSNPASASYEIESTKLRGLLMSALASAKVVNVLILSLQSGSVIANTSLQFGQSVTFAVISAAISLNIPGATLIEPSTDLLPTWMIAIICIFSSLIAIISIYLMITIGFHKPKKKSYGRDQVEFFEMENGWKYLNPNITYDEQ